MDALDTRISEQIKASKRARQTTSQKWFMALNYLFFAVLSVIMVYPFWHVLMYSFSDVKLAATGGVFLWPRAFTTATYKSVFASPLMWSSFQISVTVTLAGTALGVLLTALTAYPLSKKRLRFGGLLLFMVFFTMLFNGGMVPNYLLIKKLRWLDHINALIFPGLLSAYNVIVMKSFFSSIPDSLEESAKIDGATDVRIFFVIILPLSKAVIATIALFIAVVYWNDYFSTVVYITTKNKWSMQAVLREMLTNTQSAMKDAGVDVNQNINLSSETIKSATVIIATVPILIVYPFLQKYFVKGVMLGSVKG